MYAASQNRAMSLRNYNYTISIGRDFRLACVM